MRRTTTIGPAIAGDPVQQRKAEHMQLAAVQHIGTESGAGWLDVHLVHHALPAADLSSIELGTEFLGRRLQSPLLIAAMTGGHRAAGDVNACLARAAERFGLPMGVGSQRAALRNPQLASTYTVAREAAPHAFLIANVGAAQLVPQESGRPLKAEQLSEVISMIGANALAIHFNFLEEMIQPEGDRRVARLRETLRAVLASLAVPAIAKETGAGLSGPAALELRRLGFRALDVGGLGGTSFAAIESVRAQAKGDARRASLGRVYRDWGIPTPVSIAAVRVARLPIIATGGVRTGLDAAKAIALGASLVGVGRPLLAAALRGDAAVEEWITRFLEELRVAIFLTGGKRVGDLRLAPRVVVGETRRWIEEIDDTSVPAPPSRRNAARRRRAH